MTTTWNIEGLTGDEFDTLQMALAARLVRLEDQERQAIAQGFSEETVESYRRKRDAVLSLLRRVIEEASSVEGGAP